MDGLFPGAGTLINVVAVLVGATCGMAFGARLPQRVHDLVTDALGLVTLLMAGLSAVAVGSSALEAAVGEGVPILLVLGALLLGGVSGSLLRLEARLEVLAGGMQARQARGHGGGPGPLNDGLGNGIDQLALTSALDLFAALALASAFGVGVLLSAVSVLVVQGLLTLLGATLGEVVPVYAVDAMTAVGGLLLVGIALGLLRIRSLPVGDLLPALVLTPVGAWLLAAD
ncbi:DUF554 family protein [Kytococcus sp. HMSC28H12]|uniref:DUF554 family protein n=1 Tax=Kytococcus sp. HMSC28H12 TaxID=1581067 RepID=UPI0009F7257F|nr:DUF554 family protein [Kytococcus sp. HMSC28H12]